MNLGLLKQKLTARLNGLTTAHSSANGANSEGDASARRDALISKITSALHSSLDSDEVLKAIVDELGRALSVCRCRVSLVPHPIPDDLSVAHEYVRSCCYGRPPISDKIPSRNNAFLEGILNSDKPTTVDDVLNDDRLRNRREHFEELGIKSLLSSGIRLNGEAIGLLSLLHCEETHSWTDWEVELVRLASEQAAVAIRQAELYREVRESATRSALVNQIITSIRRSLDLEEMLQAAVEEIGRALGANRTYFRKLVGDKFVSVAEHLSDPSLSLKDISPDTSDYVGAYLTRTLRTLVIDDIREFMAAHPGLDADFVPGDSQSPYLSQIACPIIVGGRFWGMLSIAQTDRNRTWTPADVALIEIVSAQIEVAVSHSNLFQEARQAADRQALISHIIHGVNQSNKLDEILPIIVSELGDHLSVDRLSISQPSPDGSAWIIEYSYQDGKVTRPGTVIQGADLALFTRLTTDDVILCDDVDKDPRVEGALRDNYLKPAGTRSFMAIRLPQKERFRLVISASMTSGPRHWTSDDVEVARAAVDHLFIALQRAELFEQVLRGKHEWEATFDALTDGILIFDRNGVLVRINQAGAAFEAAPVLDLIGRRCCELMQGEDETCRVAEVISSGRPLTYELIPGNLGRPLLITISPLTESQTPAGGVKVNENPPMGAVCVVRDLSELRAAEAVAREQRNFLVKLIEHANDAIFAFSPTGKLVWFNEQLVTLSGYTRVELSASDYRRFVTGDDKKVAMERFARAMIGEPQTFEIHALKKDGEARLLMMTFSPIYDEDGVSSVLTVARDITEERVASERAAQADKLRALGQLASGVAHNFNNILAAILGHAQLIKRDCREEVAAHRMEVIERAALDGAETVKRIQAFGLQQNEAAGEVVDLNQIARDSTELTRARWCDEAEVRGLRYDVELNLKNVPVVKGAASELREVFVNIILNALDAMPQGGKLRISTDTYGPHVRIIFADTGIGMTRDVYEHIFEPFFSTKGTSGMGLGLAVSYSIIERHGGRIEVASAPGRGTAFTISIPVSDGPKVLSAPHRTTPRRRVSTLVIDDDKSFRDAMVAMLNSAGHQAEWASTAREGLAKMELGRFDLVFTDLSMPEIDGWALANEIRRGWPSVKIVLVTSQEASPETVRHYREFVDQVLYKPIHIEDISATVSQVLNHP